MTGVITRRSDEPYANSARTVLWEVRGASRAPTRFRRMHATSRIADYMSNLRKEE